MNKKTRNANNIKNIPTLSQGRLVNGLVAGISNQKKTSGKLLDQRTNRPIIQIHDVRDNTISKYEFQAKDRFIEGHFNFKECMKFRPNPEDVKVKQDSRALRCICGEVIDKHFKQESLLPTLMHLNIPGPKRFSIPPNSEDCIQVIKHTNAYGRIKFISDDPIKKRLTEVKIDSQT